MNYSSWLNSFEVNLPCCCGCCDECGGECRDACGCGEVRDEYGWGEVRCRSFEWFAGFRYINLGEKLNISVQRIVLGLPEKAPTTFAPPITFSVRQLGARLRRWWGRFGWEATGKAGIFGNDAQETQSVTDFPNFPLRPTVSSSGGEVAFVGEINLSAFYRLTDVWNLRAGYNVMWIGGLALAPDQLDFNFATSPGGNQLHNGGGMFLQGSERRPGGTLVSGRQPFPTPHQTQRRPDRSPALHWGRLLRNQTQDGRPIFAGRDEVGVRGRCRDRRAGGET